jgi:hypothetical protein
MVKEGGFLLATWKNGKESHLAHGWRSLLGSPRCAVHSLHYSKKMNKRNVEDGGIDGDGTSCLLSQNEKKKNVSSLLSDSKFTCVKPKD